MAKFYELPPPAVREHQGFNIVRDDFLLGGSKMRYMLPLIQRRNERIIVYATPCYGYAQIALAKCCEIAGRQAVVFVAKRNTPHVRTMMAKNLGAIIYQVPHGYLSHVEAAARKFTADHDAYLVPWGVDLEEALEYFAEEVRAMPDRPKEVWACAGSGSLIRGLQKGWPDAKFHAVQIGAEPNIGGAQLWKAPEKFDQNARHPPPFPSCSNYDAKVWQFITKHGSPGAYMWNLGG